jgi:hypothetical protein
MIRIHAKFESILNLTPCGIWKRIWKFEGIFYYQPAIGQNPASPLNSAQPGPPILFVRHVGQLVFLVHRPASARPALLVFPHAQPTGFSIPRPRLPQVNPAWPNQPSRRSPGVFTEGTEGKVSPSWILLRIKTKSEFKLGFGTWSWSNPCYTRRGSKSPINRVASRSNFAKIEVKP